jgi:DNA replication protein DnaC
MMERASLLLGSESVQGSFAVFLERRASPDPTAKTWRCPVCGTILPREIKPGLYLRRSCACEEQQREEREAAGIRQQIQAAQRAQTFGWMGQEWVEPHLEDFTFAAFDRRRHPLAFDQAHAFALAPHGTLALTGRYGSGKTHLLVAMANARREANLPCLYVSAVALFEAIQERIHQDREYHPLLQRAAKTPLLLIDDLDKPKPSEFRESIYYLLFNQRNLARLPLAITCNCHPRELERWIGGAALSRLMQGLIPLDMQGADYRLLAHPSQ